jgi:hypothetical protein
MRPQADVSRFPGQPLRSRQYRTLLVVMWCRGVLLKYAVELHTELFSSLTIYAVAHSVGFVPFNNLKGKPPVVRARNGLSGRVIAPSAHRIPEGHVGSMEPTDRPVRPDRPVSSTGSVD